MLFFDDLEQRQEINKIRKLVHSGRRSCEGDLGKVIKNIVLTKCDRNGEE